MKVDIKWLGPTLHVDVMMEVFDGKVEYVITIPRHPLYEEEHVCRGKTLEEVVAAYVAQIDRVNGRVYYLTDGIDPNGIFNLTLVECSAMCQETYHGPARSEDEAIAEYRGHYLSILRLTPEQVARAEDMLSLRVFHREYQRNCEKCNYPHRYRVQNSPTTCQPDCATFARAYLANLDPSIFPRLL